MEYGITKEIEAKVEKTELILSEAEKYKITTQEHYINAGEELKKIKAYSNELDSERKAMTKPLDESKKRIMDFFKKPLDMLNKAESVIKNSMLLYQQEEEQKRLAEERKLQEKAKREEDQKKKQLEERAKKWEEKGNIEKAQELREQVDNVIVFNPTIAKQDIKIDGISTKSIWKFRITDETKIPREYLIVNEKALQGIATATKGAIIIPGVEFYPEEIISARKAVNF